MFQLLENFEEKREIEKSLAVVVSQRKLEKLEAGEEMKERERTRFNLRKK